MDPCKMYPSLRAGYRDEAKLSFELWSRIAPTGAPGVFLVSIIVLVTLMT